MKVKEQSEKIGLKLNIKKTKIIVSIPVTSWQIEGEKVGAVVLKSMWMVTAVMKLDGDCFLAGKL